MAEESRGTRATHGYVDDSNVGLKEYLEKAICSVERLLSDRITLLEKALDARFQAQQKALEDAGEINEKRLDALNQSRESLRDQTKSYITKGEHDALIASYQKDVSSLNEKIVSLSEFRAEIRGKASQSQLNINFIFTIISLILAIAGIILGFYGK